MRGECPAPGTGSPKALCDPRVTTAEPSGDSGTSENEPGRWAGAEPGHLLPDCRRGSQLLAPGAGGAAVSPQLCLCAGSAAGSVPAAVSLCLHPAVIWHRAQVLG